MGMPGGIGIVDTMIGFPADDFKMYDFIRAQLKDGSTSFDFPVEYMFRNVPKELYGSGDPISITLQLGSACGRSLVCTACSASDPDHAPDRTLTPA